MDKVSIIVPVYNVEKYINRTLSSICGQTHQNLEILLIDDGSEDDSLRCCKEWESKDNRILVYHQQNAGASAARNMGINHATGKYIMFLDGDDWIEREMIQVLYQQAEKYQADAACCLLQEETPEEAEVRFKEQENMRNRMDLSGEMKEQESNGSVKFFDNKEKSGLALLRVWGPVCKLYRRDVIGAQRFENYQVAEDLLFNSKVICSKMFEKAVLVEYPFYHYIIYAGSTMKQQFQQKYVTAMEIEAKCYDMLTNISDEYADINLIGCSVSRVFEKYAQLSKKNRRKHKKDFNYCKKFAKKHKKALLAGTNRHRRISGALKVYLPDFYLGILIARYKKKSRG